MKRKNSEKNILADAGIKSCDHVFWWQGKTKNGRSFVLERNMDQNFFNLFIDGCRPSIRLKMQTAINKINTY